ncbi:hypothetical protein LTR62_002706 [Meristemomyces frigidus]|uniref:Uncharacterized protein n=1 Tax=Meristemomyces frigidus TaxID=1508187 RepID=A0AAN7TFW6_9PEZI|nr:hypothetical protein LTR62_002706 [Meristemomyces frigidus]
MAGEWPQGFKIDPSLRLRRSKRIPEYLKATEDVRRPSSLSGLESRKRSRETACSVGYLPSDRPWKIFRSLWISSAIDELPFKPDFELFHSSEPQNSERSGFSQHLGDQSLAEVHDSHLSAIDLQQITPDKSTQTDTPPPKKKKGKA